MTSPVLLFNHVANIDSIRSLSSEEGLGNGTRGVLDRTEEDGLDQDSYSEARGQGSS